MIYQQQISIRTSGRSTTNITHEVEAAIHRAKVNTGLCHVFIHHTSASLIITENADPSVRRDLEYFMSKYVRDGDPSYHHDMEGDDDMAAHIRSVITQTEVTIPVSAGQSTLGTWQGIFLWEHRFNSHQRKITVTVSGE